MTPDNETEKYTQNEQPDSVNEETAEFQQVQDEQKKQMTEPENKIVYINFTPPNPDMDDFWAEDTEAAKKKKCKAVLWFVCLAAIIMLILCYSIALEHGKGWFTNLFGGSENIEFTLPIADTPDVEEKYTNEDGSYTTAGLAKAVLPSVVQIQVYSESATLPTSQGSGIIISEDGYIVTNAHVISDADFGITVMLYDKTEYSAKIVGSDESTDIAVLKIGAENLTPAQFADSDKCELGDDVIAVGSPAGYENSVTKGIISGLDRKIRAENSATAMNCIQIDAAINPGNSGGALFNMWGQVIGITSSKLVSTSYDNMGFAITVNSAKPIIEELMENGYIPDRGKIGVTYYTISSETAKLYGVESGICVVEIDPDCNVAQTDLQSGDIITEINGQKAEDTDAVTDIMSELRAGDEVTCKVYRPADSEDSESKSKTFEITFELNSDKTAIIKAQEEEDSSSNEY